MALDFHERYSTMHYLSKELIKKSYGRLSYVYEGIEVENGEMYGECVDDLFSKLTKLFKRINYYQYGENEPRVIYCSPGGGNIIEIISKASMVGVDTYIIGEFEDEYYE